MTTLVSNLNQDAVAIDPMEFYVANVSQAFTTGSHPSDFTLTGIDIPSASSTPFTAFVCGVDTNGKPASPCTGLTAPTGGIAAGTNSFDAPASTRLTSRTTYAVVVSGEYWKAVTFGRTNSDGEDTGHEADWSIADGAFKNSGVTTIADPAVATWGAVTQGLQIAIKGYKGSGTPGAPAAPTDFQAEVGDTEVELSWDAPASDADITRHEFRYKTGSGSYPMAWTQIANSAPGGANQKGYTVGSLTNEIVHTFQLRAVNTTGNGLAAEDTVTPTPGICGRTVKVQELIIYYLGEAGVTRACAEVNVADLASFTGVLEMASSSITSLNTGDFAGLTNVTSLTLGSNTFTTLPAKVFSGLTALVTFNLIGGELSSIDAEAFSGLAALENIILQNTKLSSVDADLFSGLTSLDILRLHANKLSSLPAGVFTGLALTELQLHANNLTSLPDGLLSGLTGLTRLSLGANPNTGDTLPLTVTVEKFGTDEVRAKVLAGAPFDVEFTPTLVNGELAASDTKLAVDAGAVDGTAETVTRTAGEAVTVDVDLSTQPSLPANHSGYTFAKAAGSEPAAILSAAATVTDREVTSTPVLETDTYGAGERIEVSVTFSEAVNATPDTDFVLSAAHAAGGRLGHGDAGVRLHRGARRRGRRRSLHRERGSDPGGGPQRESPDRRDHERGHRRTGVHRPLVSEPGGPQD